MVRADIIRLRLRNERLTGVPFVRPEDVVSWMGVVQSQDYAGAKWGLARRCAPGVTSAQIDALFNAGKILRTHVMRPTWHFVAPADLRWLLKLTAPRVHQVNAYMYRQLELDAAVFRKSRTVLEKNLQGGVFLTREEIADAYAKARIVASGHRLAYLVMHAELEGVICSGPVRGKKFTYALLEERVTPAKALEDDDALVELTRRFFTSHGPAQPQDFAWWSGLTLTEARRGLELAKAHLVKISVDGADYWSGQECDTDVLKQPVVHLLPNYDEFVGSYRDNSLSLNPALLKKRQLPDVLSLHILVLNGLIVGGWAREIGKREAIVTTDLLVKLTAKERAALERAAEEFGRFLELPVTIEAR